MRSILFLFFVLTISSCCENSECDQDCNQWEQCYEINDANTFCSSWACRSIIAQYWGDYLGPEIITFNNGVTINNDNKAIYLDVQRPTDQINSIRIKIDRINYNDTVQYIYRCTENDLIIYFINPLSTNFNIPKQTTFGPIYSPTLDSVIYTNISYEGIGNIDNGIISISATFEFNNSNGSYNYVGPNNWF